MIPSNARAQGFKTAAYRTVEYRLDAKHIAEAARVTLALAGRGYPGDRTCFCARSAHKPTAFTSGACVACDLVGGRCQLTRSR